MAIKGSVDPKLQKIKTALENIVARKHYTKTEIDSKLESKIDKTNLKTITSYKDLEDIDTVDYTVTYDDGSTETITGLIAMNYIKAVFKNSARASNLSGSNMRVDYGDGTIENINGNSFNHDYSDDKTYTAKIYGVTSIGEACFAGNDNNLVSVTIPSSVTSIGRACFATSSLTSVNIPSSITSLNEECFVGCLSLTSITIPSSVTSIGIACFIDCRGLTSVTIPSSVTSMGQYCFGRCNNLVDYYLYWDSVSSIIEYDTDIMSTNDETIFHIPSGTTQLYIDKDYPSDKLQEMG